MSKVEQLLDKIEPTWTGYLNDLKTTAPINVLSQAYELVIKSDIIEVLEEMAGNGWDEYFGDEALDTLLGYDDPLDVIFEAWYDVETNHMEYIREAIRRAGGGDYRHHFAPAQKGEGNG